jgi:hypothetical protein
MDEKPKRRWFQFRLSTWFVLVAILAWGMVARPLLDFDASSLLIEGSLARGLSMSAYLDYPIETLRGDDRDADNVCLAVEWTTRGDVYVYWLAIVPKYGAWPILALVAFLAWKAAWAVVACRRARRATQT